MDDEVLEKIKKQFPAQLRDEVIAILSELKKEHVMAKSYSNWYRTHLAILELAKGDIEAVRHYTNAAKSDFRDVIYWATKK